jgi:modulator of FtsH protease HflK
MPWTNQGGTNGTGPSGPRGPWGRGPSGSGNTPPGLEDQLRRAAERLRDLWPGGPFTRSSLAVIASAIVGIWLLSGIYFVDTDSQGVVLRFGAVSELTESGMRYHLPWPIEVAYTPRVKNENWINIGYQATGSNEDASQTGDVSEESHMLTGDENIVDVNFTVYWKIKDAPAFLFNVPRPQEATIKAVAESAMREVVGESQIERIQTLDRDQIQARVRDLMQSAVDTYGMGVTITRVKMQKADPPQEVIGAYRDVQAARADQDRKRNEAEAYANTIIPQARGQAAHIVQDAEAYRLKVIAEAGGQAKRFLSIYAEYRKAPDITRRRIYLENLSQILGPMNKVIVDDSVKGVVPYFQLPPLKGATSGAQGTAMPTPAMQAPMAQSFLTDPNAQQGAHP